ncbi:hypothetical protein Cob_v009999 [Colletotrichum orbiculare MAFF 240422]|uniref:Uncharacterized protein n=1 Tax=Colletotrichum orbiculare (strain 104-T / ATCC 96160 / CBS 514.97 / LARS 414 / MAFF 240422) TaxID=1213857 RepID=A0A484FFT7_COLOR|nr:hypothetical protein Cob_v009999 [Colletotrichum orbiculare MAFF 240422]
MEHRLAKFVLGQHSLSVEKPQVNGYVKLQFTSDSRERYESERPERWWYRLCGLPDLFFNSLNPIDRRLFEFYVGSWCPGRTVLRRTNCWLTDIAQMAHKSDCVKSAIFALAGTYVVDYHPDEQVQNATLLHYKQAVLSLSLLLKLARQQAPEDRDGEALVAAIAILNMIDVVSPEQRRGQHLTPRWLDGAYLACEILDLTDPGHRYRDAANIQPSAARVGNTIIASRVAILALPMMPLDISNNGKHFGWLRQGPEVNIYRIHGGCGMSPALLSHLSQITHFAAMLHHDPIDTEFVAVQAAQATLTRLLTLPQWYEHETSADCVRRVSLDARTVGELLSHHLDEHGAIKTNEGMTASTAEAWRLAAIIYLQCRVFRLPRTHPDVLEQASSLAACIRLMPTSGYMFTAQTPFFPVFLLGIVAVTEEHSRCALQWFQSVISTRCRSSVPPAFEALERIRAWMTTGVKHDSLPVPDKVTHRAPWWEDVVAYIAETEGTLCLV